MDVRAAVAAADTGERGDRVSVAVAVTEEKQGGGKTVNTVSVLTTANAACVFCS